MKKLIFATIAAATAVTFAEPQVLDSRPDGSQCNESAIGTIYGYKNWSGETAAAGYVICVHHIYNGGTEQYEWTSCSSATDCPASEDDKRSDAGSSSSTTQSSGGLITEKCQWDPSASGIQCNASNRGSYVQCTGNEGDPLKTFECQEYSWAQVESLPDFSSSSAAPASSATAAIKDVVSSANLQVAIRGADLSISIANGSKVQVQVFDMMGHVVKTDMKSLSTGTHSVSLQSLAQGSYMVRVNCGSSSQTVRINVR